MEDTKERKTYISMFNDQEMVMNRLNNYQQYLEDIKKSMIRLETANPNINLPKLENKSF